MNAEILSTRAGNVRFTMNGQEYIAVVRNQQVRNSQPYLDGNKNKFVSNLLKTNPELFTEYRPEDQYATTELNPRADNVLYGIYNGENIMAAASGALILNACYEKTGKALSAEELNRLQSARDNAPEFFTKKVFGQLELKLANIARNLIPPQNKDNTLPRAMILACGPLVLAAHAFQYPDIKNIQMLQFRLIQNDFANQMRVGQCTQIQTVTQEQILHYFPYLR